MLDRPPREPEWASWLAVVAGSLLIFATVPFARRIQETVAEHLGRGAFVALGVLAALAAIAAVLWHARRRPLPPHGMLWLGAFTAVFVAFVLRLRSAPEEAVHFVEYGLLGIVIYRALAHRIRDLSVYPAAVGVAASIGILDEALQWATPGRVWDLRDIGRNTLAAALGVGALALGLRPRLASRPPTPRSLQLVFRIAGVTLLLLGASLLNTPRRIAWYADRVPALAYLKHKESPMFEYGFLYEHPGIGRFRSRFSPEALRRLDAERGPEAARILERHAHPEQYGEFLRRYTPVTDPFLHELRVHLYSRDYHRRAAHEHAGDEGRRRFHASVALREDAILETYFPNTLRSSSLRLPETERAALEADAMPDLAWESWVSRDLTTGLREGQLLGLLGLALGILAAGHVYWGRVRRRRAEG